MLIKPKSVISEKCGSCNFWGIANSFPKEDKSAILHLFNDPEVLSSASDKEKLFAEKFSKNCNLDDSGISGILFSLLELI